MRRLRLRTLLILLVLVTTIPIALFAAWLIARTAAQQETLIDRQNLDEARAVMVGVDQEVEDVIASLNVLALLEPIDAPDKTHFIQIASRVFPTHPNWESIRLVDPSMTVLASTSGPPSIAPLLHPQWARDVMATGRPAVSHLIQHPESKRWMVTIGVPVLRQGAVKYVLTARLYSTAFSEILRRQSVPPGGVVALLDGEQRIIARTRNEEKYVGGPSAPDFVAHAREGPEGTWRSRLLEGTQAYAAWSRSPLTGWTVGIGMPAEPVAGPVRRSFRALLAAGVGMC